MKAVAVIPARGGSQRVPRKNIAEIGGCPAISWPIRACLDSGLFSSVIVSTEDSEIADIAKVLGSDVHDRPPELADSVAKVRDVVSCVLQNVKAEYVCIVYPTAVFLTPDILASAFAEFEIEPRPDFVLGVARMSPHPWKAMAATDGLGHPVFPDAIDFKGQEQPAFFASTGTFHWARRDVFMQNGDFWKQRRRLFELHALQAIDIDEVSDLEMARAVKERQLKHASQ